MPVKLFVSLFAKRIATNYHYRGGLRGFLKDRAAG